MKIILGYVKPYWKTVSMGLVFKFFGTIMDLLIPSILAYMIDTIAPMEDIQLIFLWGGLMLLCALGSVSSNIIANRTAVKVAMLSSKKLRHDLFEKVSYLSCRQVDVLSIPSIVSRLTSDTYNIHNYISLMQRMGIRAPILLIGGLFMTMSLEPKLAMVFLALIPIMGILTYLVTKRGLPLFTKTREAADRLVQSVRENITGIRVIKALSKGDYERDKFDRVNKNLVEKDMNASNAMAISNPMMNWFLNMGTVCVIFIGAIMADNGETQPGTIIAFMSYFTIILQAMLSVTRIFIRSTKAIASAERLDEILSMPKDLEILPDNDTVDNGCHIEFDHVVFSYNKKSPDLNDISFKIKKGETLGIIGGTGSGKTTIINLLMRLYDTDSGAIRINGRNIKTIPFEELHNMYGVVFQNDVLFADTIKENIDFGRMLEEEDIEVSSEYAQALEFIEAFPDKYSHRLTIKGANLSGGQKQRLLISRALAGNPQILILDDSSSALDYKTDSVLRQELNDNFADTTSVIISQRISSIMHAEHILVLDNGNAIGYGTHEELMKSCEIYREIQASQMGDKKEEQVRVNG